MAAALIQTHDLPTTRCITTELWETRGSLANIQFRKGGFIRVEGGGSHTGNRNNDKSIKNALTQNVFDT